MTATIHDSQLDRKQFVKELGATYHRWLEEGVAEDGDGVGQHRRIVARHLGQLNGAYLAGRFGSTIDLGDGTHTPSGNWDGVVMWQPRPAP